MAKTRKRNHNKKISLEKAISWIAIVLGVIVIVLVLYKIISNL
jgi:hypothetical protein